MKKKIRVRVLLSYIQEIRVTRSPTELAQGTNAGGQRATKGNPHRGCVIDGEHVRHRCKVPFVDGGKEQKAITGGKKTKRIYGRRGQWNAAKISRVKKAALKYNLLEEGSHHGRGPAIGQRGGEGQLSITSGCGGKGTECGRGGN